MDRRYGQLLQAACTAFDPLGNEKIVSRKAAKNAKGKAKAVKG